MVARLACWPDDPDHPYQRLFYEALVPYGIHKVAGLSINDAELRRLRPDIDAIHLHWPEYAWRVGVDGYAQAIKRVAGFHRFLGEARRLGLRIIWTAHNLKAHESTWLDSIGLRLLGRQCDLILAHTERVSRHLRTRFRAQVVTMPQGNYDGAYGPPRQREAVLRDLKLSLDKPTLAIVGALRPYKGVELAVDAVRQLHGDVQLIVAGTAKPGFDLDGLLAEAARSAWLAVIPRPLSDQEFSDVVGASTGILLPYTRLTTSGVLLAAWTLSRGAVTSREPYFEDLFAEHPGGGRTADVRSSQAFARVIEEYLRIPEQQRWTDARRAADAYPWSKCVEPVARALAAL